MGREPLKGGCSSVLHAGEIAKGQTAVQAFACGLNTRVNDGCVSSCVLARAWQAWLKKVDAGMVPDIVGPNLAVLFVGYNPSLESARQGHHFAGPGNLFWALLADAGLTSRRLTAVQDADLILWNLGITNVVERATASAQDVPWQEFLAGGARLAEKIEAWRPRCVAFLGKDCYRAYRQWPSSRPVAWGWQQDARVPHILEAVLPNPSRRSTMPYGQRLRYFRELKNLVTWGV